MFKSNDKSKTDIGSTNENDDESKTLKRVLFEGAAGSAYDGMTMEIVRFTSEVAKEWLKKNHKDQRPLNMSKVKELARRQSMGLWRATNQGVAIDRRGRIVDGQHRLEAVVLSGVTIELPVWRGLAIDAIDAIDSSMGQGRNVADLIRMHYGVTCTKAHTAVSGSMYRGGSSADSRPREEQAEWHMAHKEVVTWVLERSSKRVRGVCAAPVLAACARAYYHLKKVGKLTRLSRFMEVLQDGRGEGPIEDELVVKLREYLMKDGVAGGQEIAEAYRVTTRAIVDYIKGVKDPSRFRPRDTIEDLFPLDGSAQ